MKNKIGQLDVRSFIKKYNVQNYAFTLMNYDKKKLNINKYMETTDIPDKEERHKIYMQTYKSKTNDAWNNFHCSNKYT